MAIFEVFLTFGVAGCYLYSFLSSLGVAFGRLTDIVKDLGSVLENLPDETKK